MQSISWTIEQWPVVFSRFDGDQTVADIDAYMTHVQELHQRKQLYVNISWMKEYTRGRAQLTAMGNWVKKVDAGTRAYCVASAIVTESIGFRFLLSTVFLVRPLRIPYLVSASVKEAIEFCRQEALKRQLMLPPDIRVPWADAP